MGYSIMRAYNSMDDIYDDYDDGTRWKKVDEE